MYNLIAATGNQRNLKSALRKNKSLITVIDGLLTILETDPYNRSRKHDIKKLAGIEPGGGQWRIRYNKYRLRYDIFGNDVVLYSFKHRRESY